MMLIVILLLLVIGLYFNSVDGLINKHIKTIRINNSKYNKENINYNIINKEINQNQLITRLSIHSNDLLQDFGLSIATGGLAYGWLQLWVKLTSNGVVSSVLSRKIIHCTSAPLFLLTWPLYSMNDESRLIAALVPAFQVLRLTRAGLSRSKNQSEDSLVNAISRSGDNKEALQGPLIYSIVLFLATILFYRSSSVGVLAVMQMAVGDGVADIIGRRWGSIKWPGSKKSLIGSIAFATGALVTSVLMLSYLSFTGFINLQALSYDVFARVLLVSIACALIELLPLGDDNVTVPLLAAVLAYQLIEPLI